MTLEERLALIEKMAVKDREKEAEDQEKLEAATKEELRKVEALTPRINALIVVANKCIEEGVKFPSSSEITKYGYGNGYNSYDFHSDSIHHHVGFMDFHRQKRIEYLGIVEGGFCGVWDFYTNGKSTFLKHEKDGFVKKAEFKYLRDFLKEFDQFEEAFYKWIDSLAD